MKMLSMILLLCPFMDVVRGDRDGSEEEFFYQASIKRDEKIVCGGTVINAYHVISVAHCFYNLPTHSKLPVDNIFAAAATPEDSEVVWVHAKVLIHERFAILSLDNDVAMLKLEKKFAVDEKRFPLKINQDPISEEEKCVLCGWEKATPREKRIKMEGFKCVDDVPLISREKCLKTPEYKSIALQNFCAGDGGDAKFCHDNIGRSLMCDNKLTGIFVYGLNCEIHPSVYVNISMFFEWIEIKSVKNNSPDRISAHFVFLLVIFCSNLFLIIKDFNFI